MDIGIFLLILAFSYGIGVFWYDLLPGQLPSQAWRAAAYPFAAISLEGRRTRAAPEHSPHALSALSRTA